MLTSSVGTWYFICFYLFCHFFILEIIYFVKLVLSYKYGFYAWFMIPIPYMNKKHKMELFTIYQCNKFMVLSIILDVLPINRKINFPWTRFAKEELIRSSNGERSSSYVCPKLYCWHRTQEPNNLFSSFFAVLIPRCFQLCVSTLLNSVSSASFVDQLDNLAEWSKALDLGSNPKGHGFKSHSCHR